MRLAFVLFVLAAGCSGEKDIGSESKPTTPQSKSRPELQWCYTSIDDTFVIDCFEKLETCERYSEHCEEMEMPWCGQNAESRLENTGRCYFDEVACYIDFQTCRQRWPAKPIGGRS